MNHSGETSCKFVKTPVVFSFGFRRPDQLAIEGKIQKIEFNRILPIEGVFVFFLQSAPPMSSMATKQISTIDTARRHSFPGKSNAISSRFHLLNTIWHFYVVCFKGNSNFDVCISLSTVVVEQHKENIIFIGHSNL